jgi:4-amino-4-deoxy-L-arabinose transferase-like glycosyltransferase
MPGPLYENSSRAEKGEWIADWLAEWLALAAVVLLASVCIFYRLGDVPLLGKDEPRYAQVAREMFASGDWVTPRLAGHTWFEKPALPYWLMAAAFSLFGVSEFSARLGSALCAALGVAAVYLLARRVAGPRRAAVSAAVLATSGLWLAFARGASFDMPLAGTMTASLASLFAFDVSASTRRRLLWLAAAGGWAGAAMLAKGLVGPLLIGAVAIAYLGVTGRWRTLRAAELAVAGAAALLVAATWYWPVYSRNGWPFVDEFFVNHHFRRYLTNKYHHPQPVYFYPVIVAAGLAPWTFFLAPVVRRFASRLRARAADEESRLLWLAALWAVIPLAFFSASTSTPARKRAV